MGGKAIRLYLQARIDPESRERATAAGLCARQLASMENPSAGIGTAAQAYAEFAGKEQVLSLLSAWPSTRDLGAIAEIYFRPAFRESRRDPRFMVVAKRRPGRLLAEEQEAARLLLRGGPKLRLQGRGGEGPMKRAEPRPRPSLFEAAFA